MLLKMKFLLSSSFSCFAILILSQQTIAQQRLKLETARTEILKPLPPNDGNQKPIGQQPISTQLLPSQDSLTRLRFLVKSLNQGNKRLIFRKSTNVQVCTKDSSQEDDKLLLELLKKNVENRQRPKQNKQQCYNPPKTKKLVFFKVDNDKDLPTSVNNKETGIQGEKRREMTQNELAVLEELGITGQIIGVTAKLLGCTKKNVGTSINTINMCHTCQYSIQFPANYSPQFHTHFTCGEGSDVHCLIRNGICVKNLRETTISILDINTSVIVQKFSLSFTVCCSCELITGSPLHNLVTM